MTRARGILVGVLAAVALLAATVVLAPRATTRYAVEASATTQQAA